MQKFRWEDIHFEAFLCLAERDDLIAMVSLLAQCIARKTYLLSQSFPFSLPHTRSKRRSSHLSWPIRVLDLRALRLNFWQE
jgi:hypothetical protein